MTHRTLHLCTQGLTFHKRKHQKICLLPLKLWKMAHGFSKPAPIWPWYPLHLKMVKLGGERWSVAESTKYSRQAPRFALPASEGSDPSGTPIPRDPVPLLACVHQTRRRCSYIHVASTHTHKISVIKFLKWLNHQKVLGPFLEAQLNIRVEKWWKIKVLIH